MLAGAVTSRGGLRLATATDAVLIVEFTDAEVVDEARSLLPGHTFEHSRTGFGFCGEMREVDAIDLVNPRGSA